MKYRNTKNYFFILIIIFAFSSLSLATTLRETFKKQINVDGKPTIQVKNSNGRIEVNSGNSDYVEIIAHIRVEGNESRAQKLIDRIEIEIEQDGQDIYIETLVPKSMKGNGGFFNWIFGDNHSSYSVDYEITVPEESDLNLNTTNGRMLVENVSGKLRMHTTNGKIEARDINGLIRCETTNGKIYAEFEEVPSDEEMIFRTTNGSIKIYLPENYGGYAELKTTNGHIDSDFRFLDDYKRSRKSKKSYRGNFGDGDGSLTCKTTNGSIYLLKNK